MTRTTYVHGPLTAAEELQVTTVMQDMEPATAADIARLAGFPIPARTGLVLEKLKRSGLVVCERHSKGYLLWTLVKGQTERAKKLANGRKIDEYLAKIPSRRVMPSRNAHMIDANSSHVIFRGSRT